MQKRWLLAVLLIIFAWALSFRTIGLTLRPFHGDEAIHADKFHELWSTGHFIYDPYEYHGPTLHYFTLPVVWLSRTHSYAQTTEATYRLVPAIFGAALILLLWWTRDGLGATASICAALLIAISPAFVFYSRYYIQEMLLVFFSYAAIACGWRYGQSAKSGWLIACAAFLGLMYATKETWIIAAFSMTVAWGITLIWTWRFDDHMPNLRPLIRPKPILLAGGVFILVSVLFFTAFFTNARGAVDAIRTYTTYVDRGRGNTEHNHPFSYYMSLLWKYKVGRAPMRTEMLIFLAAAVGFVASMARKGRMLGITPTPVLPISPSPGTAEEGRGESSSQSTSEINPTRDAVITPRYSPVFGRFITIYSLSMLLIYSTISYKTPWCLLGFWHGFILMAGIGSAYLIHRLPVRPLRYVMAAILIAAAGHLGNQAYEINFKRPQYVDGRFNPYVYSQPTLGFANVVGQFQRLAAASEHGKSLRIAMVTADVWPLPFYLRDFSQVEYWTAPTLKTAGAAIVVVGKGQEVEEEKILGEEKYQIVRHNLRPGVGISLFVRNDLWERYMQSRQ